MGERGGNWSKEGSLGQCSRESCGSQECPKDSSAKFITELLQPKMVKGEFDKTKFRASCCSEKWSEEEEDYKEPPFSEQG